MTSSITPAQAGQAAQGSTDDEIDLRQLAAALQRRWRLIAQVAGATLLLSAAYAVLSKPVWEGEVQIVLATEQGGGGRLAQLAAANPMLAGLAGLGGGGGKDSLETEVKVLESPSVLKPVYDFVRASKQRAGQNVDDLRFSDWFKGNLTVKLEKGTSVLNIAYTDTDRALVLPVIERISRAYQSYSGRDRRRDVANAVTYLRQSIDTLAPKAEASMQRAQAYALSHGLGLNDGMPAAAAENGSTGGGGGSVEANRQLAQARVLLLEQQLAQARASGGNVLFQAPQLKANDKLYEQYQATEVRLSDLRSRLRDNDELVRNLQRQRLSLINTLNRQTIGLLQGELDTARAALQSASRPNEVVLRHRELVRQALRDERTLVELENQLQLAQLEQAKQTDPWELISTPTLLDKPVAPRKGRILALGLLAGLLLGSGAALVVDRRSGRVYSADELQELLPGPLLGQVNPGDPDALAGTLTLLARSSLAGSHRVALIPVGLAADSPGMQELLDQLRQTMPHTELLCSGDLVAAASCDHQLLVTSPGAPTRAQLAQLRQQLELQGRPLTGWLLLTALPNSPHVA
jgi:succinoglycan biosynthesis transport protein ExoP